MAREDARLLPVIQWQGREFVVDVDNRQFRDLNGMDDAIGMHSPQGRAMVRQMQNVEWHTFAVDAGGQTDSAA